MSQIFKFLSLMLSYPTHEHKDLMAEINGVFGAENLLPEANLKTLQPLFEEYEKEVLLDMQENFVHLFDRTRALSLNLFEHIHGESRDRGQAMVNLMAEYEKHGLNIESQELPDYLPVFLEFISTVTFAEAQDYLRQILPILSALEARLAKRKSNYRAVFQALITLADQKADEKQLAELLAVELDDPDDKEAIDKLWQETEVAFGPSNNPNDGCPAARETLSQMTAAQNDQNNIVKEDTHG